MNIESNEPGSNIGIIVLILLIVISILIMGYVFFRESEISQLKSRNNYLERYTKELKRYLEELELSFEQFKEIEKDIINESVYNYGVMQDLFTPMYNDSVTVENIDYINGSWVFWVNHSRTLNSYWFENKISYKVAIPVFGKIFLMEE